MATPTSCQARVLVLFAGYLTGVDPDTMLFGMNAISILYEFKDMNKRTQDYAEYFTKALTEAKISMVMKQVLMQLAFIDPNDQIIYSFTSSVLTLNRKSYR